MTGPNFDRPESLLPFLSLRLRLATMEQMNQIWTYLNEEQAHPDALSVITRRGYYEDLTTTNPVIRYNTDTILGFLDTPPVGRGTEPDPRATAFEQGCGFTYACFMLQFRQNIPQLSTDACRTGGLGFGDVLNKPGDRRQDMEQVVNAMLRLSDTHLNRDPLLHDYLEGYAAKFGQHWSQKYYFMAGGGYIAYSLAVAEAYPRMLAGTLPSQPDDDSQSELSTVIENFIKDVQDNL